MRYCDKCQTTYPNDFSICPRDQSTLRTTTDFTQGMRLHGKYEVLEKIGSGGMASVYKVRHLAFNELRAIKIVSSRLLDDEVFLQRFKNEAIITRKLQHPNAVRVDDLDITDDGRPFMVMEYVDGRELRDVISKEAPLPFERAWDIGKQIVSGLGAAHKLGITHRDVKPENILLVRQEDGTEVVKVLDFGLAKVREGSFMAGSSFNKTATGIVVGTPQYLSPEQAIGKRGADIDGRADLYSVAVVVYEMLTGHLPFESETPIGILIKHIQNMPTPAHQFRPDLRISKPVSMILMKAMQKEAGDRFQSAAEMLDAMAAPDQWAATAHVGQEAVTTRDDRTATLGSDFLASLKIAPSRIPTPVPGKLQAPKLPEVPVPAPVPAPVRSAPPPEPVRRVAAPAEAPNFPLRYSDAVPSGGAAAAVATAPVKEAVSKPVTRTTYVPPPPAKSKVWWWAVAAVVVVGGALGTALYLQKKPLQLPTVVPMATSPRSAQDNRIKTSVSGALASHDYNKLTVAVDQGVVTLGGNVSTAAQADDAVRLATVQDGVKQVRNEISFPAIAPAGAPGPTPEAARREKPAERPAARPVVAKTERVTTQQRRRVQALLAQGDRLTLAGEYAAAIEAYNSVLAIDRTDPAARAGLARAEQAKAAEENILRRRR